MTDAQLMALTAGTRLGPYEVTALVGVGGMGEVYRARDTKLDRQVAIKVLPDLFSSDPDRLARFEREAKTLAALNHPNIAAIYGLEESGGTIALVMELVEGPTLAERIEKSALGSGLSALGQTTSTGGGRSGQSPGPKAHSQGPSRGLPLDEALAIAKQIADALEAAHEAGIVHRDLKPANIKVRDDGTVKVLDFGLAKLTAPNDPNARYASQAPTITTSAMMTGVGMILGTAAYMSPEQARGKVVDKRADIWAFGCVLYEMLTGRRAFDADDVSLTMARVLEREVDFDALPASVPARVRQALRVCLRKDPKQRVRDIHDVRLALEGAFETAVPKTAAPAATTALPVWRRPWAAGLAGALVAGVVGLAVWSAVRPDPLPAPQLARFEIPLPPNETLALAGSDDDLAISPDGTRVVYRATAGGRSFLAVRAIGELTARPLQGTDNTVYAPFISPDGAWVGFSDESDGTLKRVSILGGPAVRICVTGAGALGIAGASWGEDGAIVFGTGTAFGTGTSGGLRRVASSGGEPEELTKPASGETQHAWPDVLPGGRAVLFTILGTGIENAQVAVLDLETRQQKVLLPGGSYPRYASTGHIVYGIDGTLRAVPFDLDQLEVTGPPIPVLEGVVTKASGAANFALARDGTLVYLSGTGEAGVRRTLTWVDRMGREEPLPAPERGYFLPRISPDGTRVALDINDQEADIWTWDFARQTLTRLTFDPASDDYPVWSPDSRRLIFASARAGRTSNLFWQASDGTGAVERLTESPIAQFPYAVTPDGTRIVFREDGATANIMLMPLQPPRQSQPLVQTMFNERNAEIASDGRWIAYEANESGRLEIYVRPFPDVGGGRWQVSTGGGRTPLWSGNGRELFYVSPEGVMGVRVEAGPSWRSSTPERVLQGRYYHGIVGNGRTFDIAADGRRFLMIKEGGIDTADAGPQNRIFFVQHWTEELKRLVPAN